MIQNALLVCLAIGANCAYAAAGLAAAHRYGIALSLRCGAGAAVLVAGTAIELIAIVLHPHGISRPMLIAALGAVVAGAACDCACGYVFDAITLPCLGVLIAASLVAGAFPACVFGAAACGGALALLYALTRGRGLGLGDVKLACCIGGAAGAANGLAALGIAFASGGAYAAYLLLSKRAQRGDELRFAPYLAAGMCTIALHGVLP